MKGVQLLAEIQKVQANHYRIVGLINANKYVFDRPGLKPNAVDCIDKAVDLAKRKSISDAKAAYGGILLTYDMFSTVLNTVERTNYWSSERVTGTRFKPSPDSGISRHAAFEGPYNAQNAAELQALRILFGIYVKSKLLQHGMPEYVDALGIADSVRV